MATTTWSKERKRLVELVYEMSPEYHHIDKNKFVELYMQWYDKWRKMELKEYIRLWEVYMEEYNSKFIS